jgi:hypothetical protein
MDENVGWMHLAKVQMEVVMVVVMSDLWMKNDGGERREEALDLPAHGIPISSLHGVFTFGKRHKANFIMNQTYVDHKAYP